MEEVILELIGTYGNAAVFCLILIENVLPPIPSEVILTFSGFMTTCTLMTVHGAIFASTCGSVLGALILYAAGYLISEQLLENIFSGWIGKVLHFNPKDIEKAKEWFSKKGVITVFICRLVPVIRSLISIPAGISKMHPLPFLLLTTLGSSLWNTALIMLGEAAGDSWEEMCRLFELYSDTFLILLGLMAVIVFFSWRLLKRKK